jgi:ABC-type Fe3+ transport system substrate-binding protein
MLLMRGERGVFLYCNMSLYKGAVEKGAPIEWITADPNVGSEVVIAIAEKSDNPTAARAFYDFVMSERGQNTIANAFSMQPVHPRALLPEVFKDAANVPVVFSPSEFQIQRLHEDPDAMKYYERFAADVFGLR